MESFVRFLLGSIFQTLLKLKKVDSRGYRAVYVDGVFQPGVRQKQQPLPSGEDSGRILRSEIYFQEFLKFF